MPQAGTYVLSTPDHETLIIRFERVGPSKIRVTVTGKRGRSCAIDVVSPE